METPGSFLFGFLVADFGDWEMYQAPPFFPKIKQKLTVY
jgi:hypothetical protein